MESKEGEGANGGWQVSYLQFDARFEVFMVVMVQFVVVWVVEDEPW